MSRKLIGLLVLVANSAFAYPRVCRTPEGGGEPVCTNVFISGCSVEGANYAEEVSCETVRHQGRPFRKVPAPRPPNPQDARLEDPDFMGELGWVTRQVRSCGCACCHDTSKLSDFAMWDINKPFVWIAQMTNRGIVIMSGQLPSSGFGDIAASENNGFDRSQTGAPTTDVERFKAFFKTEADRRGITPEEIAKMKPLNPPPGTPPPQ